MSSKSPSPLPEDQDSPPKSPPPMANSPPPKSKHKDSPPPPPSDVSQPSDPPAGSLPPSNRHKSPLSESPESSPAKKTPSKSHPPPKSPKASPPPEQNSPPPPPPEQNSAPPPPPEQNSAPPPPPEQNSAPPPVPSPSPPPLSPPPSTPALSPPASPPPPSTPPPSPPASPPPSNSSPSSSSPPSSNTPSSANTPPRSSPPPATRSPAPPPSILSPPLRSPPSPSLVPPRNPSTSNASRNKPETSGSASDGGVSIGSVVAIALVLGFLLVVLFLIAFCWLWMRTRKTPVRRGGHVMPTAVGSSPESDSSFRKVQKSTPGSGSRNGIVYSPREPGGLGNSRSWFTYEELVEATDGFSAHNLLGEGGFGRVYKGSLADGREVAVKQLKIGGGQGDREFRSEVEIISRIHHRHLVSLVGYSIYENGRLLVYDYVPNNNLYFHLHGEGRPVLDWAMRVKIAVGAARGIAYLHEDCRPRVIHRDIKSSNILLDSNFEARVSDFGLAKLAVDMDTHISTRVMGTFGYMAPEYASSGKLTEKSDVFSYGVVLLELLTGRKHVDASQPLGEESLVEWARPLLSHALETQDFGGFADPRLEGRYVGAEMFRMIEAAAACVRHSSTKRPKMGQVLRVFDRMVNSDLTNGMRVGQSELFDPAQQSAEIKWFRRMAFGSQDETTDLFSRNWSGDQFNQDSGRRE